MTDRTYYAPHGGLPPQTALLSDRAVFTEAYAVIPKGVLRDITTSYLPFWEKTRAWVLSRPLSGFAETFSQYIMDVEPEGGSDKPEPDVKAECVLFVSFECLIRTPPSHRQCPERRPIRCRRRRHDLPWVRRSTLPALAVFQIACSAQDCKRRKTERIRITAFAPWTTRETTRAANEKQPPKTTLRTRNRRKPLRGDTPGVTLRCR